MACVIAITRERNKYTFSLDNGKVASVDLDNHIHPFIGVSGKETKNIPSSIRGIMGTILENACHHYNDYTFTNKEYIDRIISLPDISLNIKELYIKMIYNCRADNTWFNAEWRGIIEMIRKDEQEQNERYFDLFVVIEQAKVQKLLAKYNLEDCSEWIDLYHLDYLEIKAFRSALRTACKDKYEKARRAVMELFETEDENRLEENFGIHFERYDKRYHVRKLYDLMTRAEVYREKIGLTDYQYTNIERDYEALRARYEQEKTRIDNEFFARNQRKYNLSFESGNYKIFVPTSREELFEIGKYFCNCANTWEWENRLSRGRYALVVVTMKNTGNYRVCCDICLPDLTISQYLGQYNNRVDTEALLTFKQKYQEYLNTLRTV